MRTGKKAEAGIGTLILFIAMILVAAVAAGVLIQTASSLQSKALSTGSKAKTQVSTAAVINNVFGEDGIDGSIDTFFIEMKLAPGADGMKFNDALLEFILTNGSQSMSYNTSVATCGQSSTATLTTLYNVEYVINGSNHRDGYLQQGDVVKLCYNSTRSVTEDEEFRISFTPKTGSISQITATTPEIMTTVKAQLFP